MDGKRTEMGLGPWPAVTPARGQELAAEQRLKVVKGGDPIAETAAIRAWASAVTVSDAVAALLAERKRGW